MAKYWLWLYHSPAEHPILYMYRIMLILSYNFTFTIGALYCCQFMTLMFYLFNIWHKFRPLGVSESDT
jgi:hypothetical protein